MLYTPTTKPTFYRTFVEDTVGLDLSTRRFKNKTQDQGQGKERLRFVHSERPTSVGPSGSKSRTHGKYVNLKTFGITGDCHLVPVVVREL